MTIFDPVKLKGAPYHLRESSPEELALHRARIEKFERTAREFQRAHKLAGKVKQEGRS